MKLFLDQMTKIKCSIMTSMLFLTILIQNLINSDSKSCWTIDFLKLQNNRTSKNFTVALSGALHFNAVIPKIMYNNNGFTSPHNIKHKDMIASFNDSDIGLTNYVPGAKDICNPLTMVK